MSPLSEPDTARLLLQAARYLGETLEPPRVFERFGEIMAEAIPHDGVVVSSYDAAEGLIRCDYAWVDGELLDPAIFPPVTFNREGGGMQSQVIRTGEPLLTNDVAERVKDSGTYYEVDRTGSLRKVPDEGAPATQAAMMLPIKHEGDVVGVVQLMNDHGTYSVDQLELAEGIVAQLAASVRNARLYEAAQAEAAARLRAEEERRRLEAAEAAARAVAAEREDATRVLEAVGDGIVVVDADGLVRFWNRRAEILTGLPRERVRGREIAQVFADWPAVAAAVPIADVPAEPQPVTVPVEVGARERWLSFVAVRSGVGVVYAFRDLTAERRLEESKSDFIATVSHELRTPMTAVLGASKTLLRHDIALSPERRRELLEMIAAQAVRLSQVTEEVLLASSLDRGEVALDTAHVEVEDVVRETVAALAENLPRTLSLEVALGAAGLAVADRDRLQQVLVNLIDNAVKYSPNGGTVVVSTARTDGLVRVGVADEGIGIPPADQDRVFEKFYRADPNLTTAPSGTGLGLYICRELVRRMGGRLALVSEVGVGTTVTVELRAAAAA